MTTRARTPQFWPSAVGRDAVAGSTFQIRVCAVDIEICLPVVIEQPEQPAVWIMARRTVRPQTFFMRIIFCVTIHTGFGRVFVGPRQVALFAWCRRMDANQRKCCQVMFEKNLAPPIGFSVAIAT